VFFCGQGLTATRDHVDPSFLHLLALSPLGYVTVGVWGALWGSFFNVVIVRLPEGESLVRPASHCRSCGAPVRWYDNIPLLSYLILRGRCRRCGARYSARYLLVELLVCVLALLMHHLFVVRAPAGAPIAPQLAQLAITSLFCGTLVAITFIDLDHLIIPDAITYPGIPLAVLLSLFMGLPHLWDGAVGAAAGYLFIRLIADGYRLIKKRMGMGYGDAKLLAMIGGLLGWQVLLPTLLLGCLQGAVVGIPALLIARRSHPTQHDDGASEGTEAGLSKAQVEPPASEGEIEEQTPPLRYTPIPFGPFLALAAVEVLALRSYLPPWSLFVFPGAYLY